TDSPTNKGDSGGPLMNDRGEVLGVNQGFSNDARHLTWFISAESIKPFVERTRRLLKPTTAAAYVERGTRLLNRRRLEGALADFQAAIKLNPKYAPAYGSRAEAHLERGQHQQALDDCAAALRLDPKFGHACLVRATVHMLRRNYDEAIAESTRAVEFE